MSPLTSQPSPGPSIPPDISDRAQGCVLGLAVGDALGTTLEFSQRDAYPSHTEMTGGGPFSLRPGEWTDDTALALALADSLISSRGLDPHDLMTRFVSWWREGRYSCTGTCFDIGGTTARALARFIQTGDPFAGSTDEHSAGNGSLMRASPIALFALHDEPSALRLAREQSRTTHAAPQCLDACGFFVQLLREAVLGEPDILRSRSFQGHPSISAIAVGSYKNKTRDQIRSGGYVVDTLEAALWAVHRTSSFEEAVTLAVNLGHDSDTIGAVTGQLAGALYGATSIPQQWLQPLAWRDRLTSAADLLWAGARQPLL